MPVVRCSMAGFRIHNGRPIALGHYGRFVTQSGNPSSYKAVIEADESGRPAVEKLEPFHP